ncbi:MAG: class I mannose-6-phosphate isomerase [Cypionkella sp.]
MTGRVLPTRAVEKPWGRDRLPAPFSTAPGERIGEIWFEPPPELPDLLVKYLFTSEKLSVQVHPSDAQAPPGERGKDECWLVLAAEPGAKLAIGFTGPVSPEAMRAAAADGTIEHLLAWHDVRSGDFIYLPAGTVHAIGAGLSLIEVQQASDVTYRLFDYGRPRELHLEQAIAVARGGPHPAHLRRALPPHGAERLVEGPHFRLDRLDGPPTAEVRARYGERPLLAIPLDQAIGAGATSAAPGQCALAETLADLAIPHGAQALVAQPL